MTSLLILEIRAPKCPDRHKRRKWHRIRLDLAFPTRPLGWPCPDTYPFAAPSPRDGHQPPQQDRQTSLVLIVYRFSFCVIHWIRAYLAFVMTVTIFSFCILYHAHHSLYQVHILLIDSHLRHIDDNYLAIIHISVLTYNQLLFNNYITFLLDLQISTYCFVESIYDWMVTTPSSSISKPKVSVDLRGSNHLIVLTDVVDGTTLKVWLQRAQMALRHCCGKTLQMVNQ